MIVRADLAHGLQVAQATHAAGESVPEHLAPLPTGTIAVALHARDEAHLRAVCQQLCAAGISHRLIVEDNGQAMAIGIKPTRDRSQVRKVVSALPLVR